jgi:hypothetical protein
VAIRQRHANARAPAYLSVRRCPGTAHSCLHNRNPQVPCGGGSSPHGHINAAAIRASPAGAEPVPILRFERPGRCDSFLKTARGRASQMLPRTPRAGHAQTGTILFFSMGCRDRVQTSMRLRTETLTVTRFTTPKLAQSDFAGRSACCIAGMECPKHRTVGRWHPVRAVPLARSAHTRHVPDVFLY